LKHQKVIPLNQKGKWIIN